MRAAPPLQPILTAGMLLGMGLGGFFDGIVFHQLLQWHHMLTATGGHPMTTVPGLEVNTTWDGIFHSATWIATLVGLALLWNAERRYDVRWSLVLAGALLMGWGGFNLGKVSSITRSWESTMSATTSAARWAGTSPSWPGDCYSWSAAGRSSR
jgi:uncharacterized membrane protein